MRSGYAERMEILVLIMLVLGLGCFLIAAFSPVQPGRPALVPLGLAFWIGCAIIDAAAHLHG
jgi:hypothetical protein